MSKSFVVLSGTEFRSVRQWAPSANDALNLVRILMKMRRPRVRIEDELGNPVSFFELIEKANLEINVLSKFDGVKLH